MKILENIKNYLSKRSQAVIVLCIFLLCIGFSVSAMASNSSMKMAQIVYINDDFVSFIPESSDKVKEQEGYTLDAKDIAIPVDVTPSENYQEVINTENVEQKAGFKVTVGSNSFVVQDIKMFEDVADAILSNLIPTTTFENYKKTGIIEPFVYKDVKVAEIKITDEIVIEEGQFPISEFITTPEQLQYYLFHQNDEKQIQKVNQDTSVYDVMEQNNLSEIELFINNSIFPESLFYDNQEVVVNKLNPMFNYSIIFESQYEEEIEFLVNEVLTEELPVGETEIQIPGSDGKQEVKMRTRYENGEIVSAIQTDVNILVPPVSEVKLIGTYEKPGVGTGELGWPQACKTITNGYNGVTGIAGIPHYAIDIACTHQSPIYAADNGVVSYSQWSPSGGGNEVSIDHKNGYSTKYAHMDSATVEVGDVVSKGEIIGYQGTTGNSTGSHLHFEVYTGDGYTSGKRLNPMDFY